MPVAASQLTPLIAQARALVKQLEALEAQIKNEPPASVSEGQPQPRYSRLT